MIKTVNQNRTTVPDHYMDDSNLSYLNAETNISISSEELLLRKQNFIEEAIPHMKLLYNYALRLTKFSEDADDLLQDTYMRAFRFFHKFKKGTNCKAWLFKIMKNCFINNFRKDRKIPSALQYEDIENYYNSVKNEALNPNDLEYTVFSNLMDDDTMNALNSMPDDYKTVVILCDLEDLSYDEIAEFLNIPVGTVRSRLHRGRRFLQKKLSNYAKLRGYTYKN